MNKRSRQSEWLIIGVIVVALIVAPLVLYSTGYFWLAERSRIVRSWGSHVVTSDVRFYRSQWLVRVYTPIARLEGFLMGKKVEVGYLGNVVVGPPPAPVSINMAPPPAGERPGVSRPVTVAQTPKTMRTSHQR
jgi:hypothetical protein